jgi:hypothetical protein
MKNPEVENLMEGSLYNQSSEIEYNFYLSRRRS